MDDLQKFAFLVSSKPFFSLEGSAVNSKIPALFLTRNKEISINLQDLAF